MHAKRNPANTDKRPKSMRVTPLALGIGAIYRRLWFLVMVTMLALLTSCAHGTQPMPDATRPNLTIPAGQLAAAPTELPAATSTDDVELLRNHVAGARLYHAVSLQLNSLVCTLSRATGITINGAAPSPGEACEAVDRAAK